MHPSAEQHEQATPVGLEGARSGLGGSLEWPGELAGGGLGEIAGVVVLVFGLGLVALFCPWLFLLFGLGLGFLGTQPCPCDCEASVAHRAGLRSIAIHRSAQSSSCSI